MQRIVITGGVAEGKSQLIKYAQEVGVPVTSADTIGREVLEDPIIQETISDKLHLSSPFSLELLRNIIFDNLKARRQLNKILHPIILEKLLRASTPIVEIPLLLETCTQVYFDRVWVVSCGPEEQLKRLLKRVNNEKLARDIISSQLSTRVKRIFADRIFDTNRPFRMVREEFMQALSEEGLFSSDSNKE